MSPPLISSCPMGRQGAGAAVGVAGDRERSQAEAGQCGPVGRSSNPVATTRRLPLPCPSGIPSAGQPASQGAVVGRGGGPSLVTVGPGGSQCSAAYRVVRPDEPANRPAVAGVFRGCSGGILVGRCSVFRRLIAHRPIRKTVGPAVGPARKTEPWRVSEWLAATLEMSCRETGCGFDPRALRCDESPPRRL